MGETATFRRRGIVFVLSAPSGAGKNTVIRGVLQGMAGIRRCITVTTRVPAPGERDAVDYFFRGPVEFQQMAKNGELLEWAEVHGNFYGSPRWWVAEQIQQGVDVFLLIDTQGARQARQRLDDVVTIFLAPPSLAELERRIRARGRESDQAIALRLQNAVNELRCIPEYDYLVINDALERAVTETHAIVTAERLRLRADTPVDQILEVIVAGRAQAPE